MYEKSCSGMINLLFNQEDPRFFVVSVSVRFSCHDKSKVLLLVSRFALVASSIGVLSTISQVMSVL